jgi:hypothetical protein
METLDPSDSLLPPRLLPDSLTEIHVLYGEIEVKQWAVLAEIFGDLSILYRGIVILHICLSLPQTCLPTLCIQLLNFISTITSVRQTRSWCTTPGLGDSITVSSFRIDQNTTSI